MITGCFIEHYDANSDAYHLRELIFRDELACNPCFLMDSLDPLAYHVVIYDQEHAIGTGRLVLNERQATIGRIGVIKAYRGQSIGDLIVRMLVDKAFVLGFHTVNVFSRMSAIAFYESFGFKALSNPQIKEGETVTHMTITPSTLIKPCQH